MTPDKGRIWIKALQTLWSYLETEFLLRAGKLEKAISEISSPNPTWRIVRFSRVINPSNYPHPISSEKFITPNELRENLKFAKEKFKCIALDTLIEKISKGIQPENGTVCLTFDGGWIEHFNLVAPILRELQLPGSFFIPTGFVGTNELFWEDKILVVLQVIKLSGRELPTISTFSPEQNEALNQFGTEITIEKLFLILEILKQMDPLTRMITLVEITQRVSGLTEIPVSRQFMDWEEIKLLAKDPLFKIGSLGENHLELMNLTPEEFVTDLHKSFNALRLNQIEPLQILAIPHGNYSPEHLNWFDTAGIRAILSYGMLGLTGSSRSSLLLDRVNFLQTNQKTFWLKAWGV